MNPHCDPELEDYKPIFLHDNLAHQVASPYQVWLKKASSWADIVQMNIHWNILNFFCDLDLDHNRAIQSFHKTIHLMMMCHHTKFICKRISHSDNISKSHILTTLSLSVTLTLQTANQSFWKIIWLIMMHHHTTFGSKMCSNSETIIWTNIHRHFEILLWPEYNDPIAP